MRLICIVTVQVENLTAFFTSLLKDRKKDTAELYSTSAIL